MTLDEPIVENDVRKLLTDVLVQENMQNAEIILQQGSKVGEGYLGVTNSIEVKTKDKVLKLFLKAAPKDETLRQTLLSRKIFIKEIHWYKQVIPTYDDFLLHHLGKPLNLTAKCYATSSEEGEEALVFENLKEDGYRLFGRKKLLDEEHVLLVLRSYAKLHGVAYALKDQRPEVYVRITENMEDVLLDMMHIFGQMGLLKICAKTLREQLGRMLDASYFDKLDKVIDDLHSIFENAKAYDSEHKIIAHGDCWMNNMLFKYEENGTKPMDIKLLDFQMDVVRLPVFDLSYFFYCSACTKENLDKLDYYLEYYHNNLLAFIKRLGTNSDKIYPYETFRDHWKKSCRFGLLQSLIIAQIVLSENDAINIAKSVNSGTNSKDIFNMGLSVDELYVERMKNLLIHFVNNDFM